MEIKIEKCGNIIFAIILGDHLDASNAKEFKQDMTGLIEDGMVAVLDMSELQFVDSSGLGAILSCLRHLNKREGNLLLCGLTKPVRILFELVRMHRVFEIFNTREEAARTLDQSHA